MSHAPAAVDVAVEAPETESLSQAVVEAVADATETDETALPPLFETVDPDALDSLFADGPHGERSTSGHVRFEYCGYTVCAHADGRVQLLAE